MLKKHMLVLAVAAAGFAAPALAQAPSQPSAAKKELIARILKIQQPGIEGLARGLAERPAVELLASAENALMARVPADKREAVAKEIQADAKKYLDESVPLVRDRAIKLAPTTVGTLLDQKFNEEELKQVVAMMESPVYLKFQSLGDEMQMVLIEKVLADTRPAVEPKIKALEQSVAKRLGLNPDAAASGAGKAPPAKAGAAR
jgi:uncharacterized protein